MSNLLIVIFLIMGAIGIAMLFSMDYSDELPNPKSLLHLVAALALVVFGFVLFGVGITEQKYSELSSASYRIKTEVRTEIRNGGIFKTDTLYLIQKK